MAMKPIKLLAPIGLGFKKSLSFKWQWRVTYEMHDGRHWLPSVQFFGSRDAARDFIRERKYRLWQRNFKMSRRLVQTHWEDYSDSFTWNAGCGKR